MIHKCPECKSENTAEIGGVDFNNISCNNCGCMSIVTWENYKERAEAAEARAAELERANADLAKRLEQVTADLHEAQHFIQSIIDHTDKHDGTIEAGTRINIHKAERLAGVEP